MRALKYISWGDNTGYAIAAKTYVRALIEAGIDLTWTPMLTGLGNYEPYFSTTWPCPILGSVCNRNIDYDTVLIHTIPEYYPEWIAQERRPNRRIFGYTVWELERLPDHWPPILNQLDGVIVPCSWNVDIFRNSGVTVPIHVVPHLSQFEYINSSTDVDDANIRERLGLLKKDPTPFIFYTIGFWSHRKAPYLALEAYLKAFDANDPVLMVIKTTPKDFTRRTRHWRNGFRLRHPSPLAFVQAFVSRYPGRAKVVVITDDTLSDGQILALHKIGDCFVSLARTEGWGLGAFEATRLGNPVVMTGYGGQLDFLDPEFTYLVDHKMVAVHEPTWAENYKPSDDWAEPSLEHAAHLMREVFDKRAFARKRADTYAQLLAKKFSKNAILSNLLCALSKDRFRASRENGTTLCTLTISKY